jgi:hypothetical protein
MVFNAAGDLFFIGWNAALEKAPAATLPDPEGNLGLLSMADYLPFFSSQEVTDVLDVNGNGMAVDALGRVICYLWASGSTTDLAESHQLGFVRSDPDGSGLEPVQLTAGIEFSNADGLAFAASGASFGPIPSETDFGPLAMALAPLNGEETLLFSVFRLGGILQAPAAGGVVNYLLQLSDPDDNAWVLAVMERASVRTLVYGTDTGLYGLNLEAPTQSSLLAGNAAFLALFQTRFPLAEIDLVNDRPLYEAVVYEPVSDRLFVVAQIWWREVPRTLFSLTPSGTDLQVITDGAAMVATLAGIRTLEPDKTSFGINSLITNPSAIASGHAALFLGDYWTGLQIVRLDLTPPTAPLANFVESLAADVFVSKGAGQRQAIVGILNEVDALLTGGDTAAAVQKLINLRKHLDGCGAQADNNDWIKDCAAQIEARAMTDQLIAEMQR